MLTDERPDLSKRLKVLGEHLDSERSAATQTGLPAANSTAVTVRDRSGLTEPDRARWQRPRLPVALAAAATVAVLIVGLFALATRHPDVADNAPVEMPLPPDPPGPLFVLPSDLDRYPVNAGHVVLADPDADWPGGTYRWAVVGTPIDGGYDDVIGASSFGQDAKVEDLLTLGDWTVIDTPQGRVHIQQSAFGSASVVQERDQQWIRLNSAALTGPQLAELLPTIELDGSGTISVTSEQHVVFAHGTETVEVQQNTGFSVSGPDGDFWIETATLSDPLAIIGTTGDRVEAFEVAGRPGWLISQRTEHGHTPYALVWTATPRRMIAVGTNSDWHPTLDDLAAVAEQLRIVNETTWRTALPSASTETMQPADR